jgi:hypothetical protein
MDFPYSTLQKKNDPNTIIHRPLLDIRLSVGNKFQDVAALVDSGADRCLFHADIGRILGLDIEAGTPYEFEGVVSGAVQIGYIHRIHLVVKRLSGIDLNVIFADCPQVGTGVLGQEGFFQQYRIGFDLNKGVFNISELEQSGGRRIIH